MAAPTPSERVCFDAFEADLRSCELRKSGIRIKLHHQPFQVLAMLLQHPGEVVTREDLRRQLWPQDTFVDFDTGLNSAIKKLRDALGDKAESPRFVETLPRRGYRFVASVAEGSRSPSNLTSPETDSGVETPSHPAASQPVAPVVSPRNARGWWWWATAAALAVLAGSTILALQTWRSIRLPTPSNFRFTKINAPDPLYGVLSADAEYLAYVSTSKNLQESLWLRPTYSTGAGVELVPPRSVNYWGVTVAPDNKSVYYIYEEAGSGLGVLFRVATVGGVPERLLEDIAAGPVFEPGGQRMALKRFFQDARGDGARLIVARSDGSQVRQIAESRAAYPYYSMDWTTDGNILYAEGVHEALQTSWYINEMPLEGGRPKRIIGPLSTPISSLRKLNASDFIAIANDAESGVGQIWIFGPHGEARRVTNDTNQYRSISVAPAAHQLLTALTETEDTLWTADLEHGGPTNAMLRPRLLSLPSGYYDWPAWTPDGNIVYVGTPAGASRELWWTTADGKETRQLTSDDGGKRSPVVASDGHFIAYSSNRKGLFNIWRVEMDGTKPRQLTFGGSDDSPQVSPGGKWIVYESHAGGAWNVWKVPSDGGTAIRIAACLETVPALSPDGKSLAFKHFSPRDGRSRWAIVSFESGATQGEIDLPEDIDKVQWSADSRSLIFLRITSGGPEELWTQPTSGEPPRKFFDLGVNDVPPSNWSSDGKRVVYLRRQGKIDFILISGLP